MESPIFLASVSSFLGNLWFFCLSVGVAFGAGVFMRPTVFKALGICCKNKCEK